VNGPEHSGETAKVSYSETQGVDEDERCGKLVIIAVVMIIVTYCEVHY
jgi:hypothetical protein